jgi:hypothetical protein
MYLSGAAMSNKSRYGSNPQVPSSLGDKAQDVGYNTPIRDGEEDAISQLV